MTIVPAHALQVQRDSLRDPFAFARRLQTPIWIFDIDNSRIVHANEAACELWKSPSETAIKTRKLEKDMSPTVAKRLKQYQSDFIATDATFIEMWTLYPAGEPQNVMVTFRGYPLPDGRMAMQCEAVGNAESRPESLRSTEALLHTDVMIILFSKHGPPLYMNPAARNTFNPQLANFFELFSSPTDYEDMMAKLEATGEHRFVTEAETLGGRRWLDLSALKCSDAVTGEPAILLTAIDVSELKVARDRARYLADRDQLTGCFNRAYLQSFFEGFAAKKYQDQVALIFCDVDKFKTINDRNGHEFGDNVLIQIASRARSIVRSDDLVARLGGDEFVIVLNNVHNEEEVARKTNDIRRIISQPVTHEATQIIPTVSMGVVMVAPETADFTTAMREADIALYAAKQAGRDRATFYCDDMGKAAQTRATLEDDLRRALSNNEFFLQYQPRIDVSTGAVRAVEGLVRWRHPEKGVVQPNAFIPACEETGMIEMLGRQVLEMGTAQAIAWHKAGFKPDVSLNISPRQFFDPDLFQLLTELARLPNFPVGAIELEVTESVLVGELEDIADKLFRIKSLGYKIAIDDFGTGYSNLSYISRFPLDCIKVDRSFISQLPESGPIVRLILTLGQQIDTVVVAEGVETQEQMEWLKKYSCRQVQGFLLSRPIDADNVMPFAEDCTKPTG